MKPIADLPRLLAAFALSTCGIAFAYPDASPWGAANPADDESCSACHYDYAPVRDSSAIAIAGLPEAASPGSAYELSVRMADVDAAVSGFQLVATAGAFASDDAALEATETAIRSTRTAVNGGFVEWTFCWRAPDPAGREVELYLAVSASNDDQSPFGDTIHYRRFVVPVVQP